MTDEYSKIFCIINDHNSPKPSSFRLWSETEILVIPGEQNLKNAVHCYGPLQVVRCRQPYPISTVITVIHAKPIIRGRIRTLLF